MMIGWVNGDNDASSASAAEKEIPPKITQAIQVCVGISKENQERETLGLMEAMEKYKLKKGLVLTLDQEAEETLEGKKIIYKPLWKWLLE